MAISTMYPAMPGSPKTTLTADITADATSLTVADGNVLPVAPNILVIGDDENAEVIGYNAKSGNTISGLVRALGGTVASAWQSGTEVARNYTSFDHNRFKENIEDLATNKADAADVYTQTEIDTLLNAKQNTLTFDNSPTANSSNPVKSSGIKTALDGKQSTLTFDSTPTASSTNPVTSGGVKSALDAKVSKSGDTMTGALDIKSTSIDSSVTPSTTQFLTMIRGLDENNVSNSIIRTSYSNNGNETLQFVVHRVVNGVSKYNNFSVGLDASGNPMFYTDNQSAFRNGLGASSGIWPTSVGGTGGTDSGWQSLTNPSVFSGTIYYRKIGCFGAITGFDLRLASSLASGNKAILGTLPSAYRPSKGFMNAFGSTFITGVIQLESSGPINLFIDRSASSMTTNMTFYFYYTFLI